MTETVKGVGKVTTAVRTVARGIGAVSDDYVPFGTR